MLLGGVGGIVGREWSRSFDAIPDAAGGEGGSQDRYTGSCNSQVHYGLRMKRVKWAPNLASFAAAFCSLHTMLDRV